jgi:hypothetical protein
MEQYAGIDVSLESSHISNSKTRFFWLLLRDFLVLKNIGGDFVGCEGFEEDGPGGENNEGGKGHYVGKESFSLGRRLAGGLPGWLEEIEHRMPGEGEKVESSQDHGQELFAMAKIVLECIAVIFHHIEAFILNFPSGAATGDDIGDGVF